MLTYFDRLIVSHFTSPSELVTSMCLYLSSLEITRSWGYILFLARVHGIEQRLSEICNTLPDNILYLSHNILPNKNLSLKDSFKPPNIKTILEGS